MRDALATPAAARAERDLGDALPPGNPGRRALRGVPRADQRAALRRGLSTPASPARMNEHPRHRRGRRPGRRRVAGVRARAPARTSSTAHRRGRAEPARGWSPLDAAAVRAPARARRLRDAGARARGRRPAGACCCTATPTRPTRGGSVLDRLGRARPPRARASTCRASARADAAAAGRRCCPQLDALRRGRGRARRRRGRRRAVVVAGNSLGGCVALRAGRARATCRCAASCRSRPPGLDMPRWFSIIERDPLVRCAAGARRCRCPRSRRAPRSSARPTASSRSRARARRAGERRRGVHQPPPRPRAPSRALLDIGPPAAARARTTRSTWSAIAAGPARLGRPRPHGPPRGRAPRARRAARTRATSCSRACGHCPQLEAPERFARAAARLPRGRRRGAGRR